MIGPLPKEICHLDDIITRMSIWYAVSIILMITMTKFMFICIWKRMPAMNDDLLARIALIQAFFISVLVGLTAPYVKMGNTRSSDQIWSHEF